MLIADTEVEGRSGVDVRLREGRIAEIGAQLRRCDEEKVLEAHGGCLLPGLHDHHIHLFAVAAALDSVACGPGDVADAAALAAALAAGREQGGWVRATGYHESVAGELDRAALDRLHPDRPLRIQHRSGAMWVVNSLGAQVLGLDDGVQRPGVQIEASGRATGRLFRADRWLAEKLGSTAPPSLESVGRELARCGVTGVTDAGADNDASALAALTAAVADGTLPQSLTVMGSEELPPCDREGVRSGAVKILLDDVALPDFDELCERFRRAHTTGRAVAVHAVTPTTLVLAASAFAEAGTVEGDRIEHASVASPAAVELLAHLNLTVVTQPGFLFERGDVYQMDVEPVDRPWLYRGRGFLSSGVPLGGGTDAPYGQTDPWIAIRAAVDRRTAAGLVMGQGEGLSPERALELFTTPADAPGGRPRRVGLGAQADLCLLDRPWSEARRVLESRMVSATIRAGTLLWQRSN